MRTPSQTLARCTWPVLVLVCIGLLGGFHPADRTRDIVVLVAAMLVICLNLPAVVQFVTVRDRRAQLVLGLAVRIAAAVFVLTFVRGVSHERRVDWNTRDAWRLCGPDTRWPEDPQERCRVLHMCANEASVDDDALQAKIAATPGCPAL